MQRMPAGERGRPGAASVDLSVLVTMPVDQLTSGGLEFGLGGWAGLALRLLRAESRWDEKESVFRLKL